MGRQRLGNLPRAFNLGIFPVKVLFALDYAPELESTKQIDKFIRRLDFAISHSLDPYASTMP